MLIHALWRDKHHGGPVRGGQLPVPQVTPPGPSWFWQGNQHSAFRDTAPGRYNDGPRSLRKLRWTQPQQLSSWEANTSTGFIPDPPKYRDKGQDWEFKRVCEVAQPPGPDAWGWKSLGPACARGCLYESSPNPAIKGPSGPTRGPGALTLRPFHWLQGHKICLDVQSSGACLASRGAPIPSGLQQWRGRVHCTARAKTKGQQGHLAGSCSCWQPARSPDGPRAGEAQL